jgi:hypothetical protein
MIEKTGALNLMTATAFREAKFFCHGLACQVAGIVPFLEDFVYFFI